MKMKLFLVSLCAAGLAVSTMLAQAPQKRFGQPKGDPSAMGLGFGAILAGPNVEQRLTNALSLTPEQQNAVHTALQEASVQRQGLPEKAVADRKQLADAIKANNTGQIDSITADLASINQQQTSILAKTMAKIYALLTPDQQAKLNQGLSRGMNRGMAQMRRGARQKGQQQVQ